MDKSVESSRALDKIISSIGDLPATPVVISSLMGLTADINASIDKITKVLMSDQSLTARVLKLSNSSFYGRVKEVNTLKEAIILLGFKTLRSLVVAASAHSLYTTTGGENQRKLWEHSLAVAIASRVISRAIKHPGLEEAFIGGLLHDIGKLVLLQKKHDLYVEIIHEVENEGRSFVEVEEEKLDYNHADLGLLLLHKWSFPTALVNVVFEHHSPIGIESQAIPVSFIVNLANIFAKRLNVGFNDYCPEALSKLPSLEYLGLTIEDLEGMELELVEEFEEERKILSGGQ